MITNRTKDDVEAAKQIRLNIQQNGLAPNDDEIEILERGTYTINSLNRVESKQEQLRDWLNSYGYRVNTEHKTNWVEADLFTYQDHQRILNNLKALRKAFFVFSTTPVTPNYIFNWQNANSIEKILVDLEEEFATMIDYFRECGTFECGEENNG